MVTNFQRIIEFVSENYTFLAILILGIFGSFAIFLSTKMNRYRFPDWWNWKRRVVKNIIAFWVILIALKIILKGVS
jgi:hypothetical protein